MTIELSVNNESVSLAANTLLSDALQQWSYGDSKIAVAINGEFVPRSTYAERELLNGDQIDIVKPVGGG
jgi:sulfur carrier protein